MRNDLAECAMVLTLFGFGPLSVAVLVRSFIKTMLVAMKNPSGEVFFNEGIMDCSGCAFWVRGVRKARGFE